MVKRDLPREGNLFPPISRSSSLFYTLKWLLVFGIITGSMYGTPNTVLAYRQPSQQSGMNLTRDEARTLAKHHAMKARKHRQEARTFRILAQQMRQQKQYRQRIVYQSRKPYCMRYHLSEQVCIDAWIARYNLNRYGDPKNTVYAGGTPLFNETTGRRMNMYTYITMRHHSRPWWSMY